MHIRLICVDPKCSNLFWTFCCFFLLSLQVKICEVSNHQFLPNLPGSGGPLLSGRGGANFPPFPDGNSYAKTTILDEIRL